MIDVALVSAYPTEADARKAFTPPTEAAYLGVWTMPLPYGGRVHVFGDADPARLEADGWTREDPTRRMVWPTADENASAVVPDRAEPFEAAETPTGEWPDDCDLQETYPGSGIYE